MSRNTTVFGLTDKLNFGKHQGKTLEKVITEFPKYVWWALENVDWFDITVEAEELLEEVAEWQDV